MDALSGTIANETFIIILNFEEMKKHYILIFLLIFLSLDMLSSQVYKTVYVAVPGTLVDINDLYTVTHLTVTGTLDKRDFETLNTLDLVSLDL